MAELDLAAYTPSYSNGICSLCGSRDPVQQLHTEFHQGFGEVVEVLRVVSSSLQRPQPPEGVPPTAAGALRFLEDD